MNMKEEKKNLSVAPQINQAIINTFKMNQIELWTMIDYNITIL